MTREDRQRARDYERVATAIRFIESHLQDDPSLDSVASEVGLSPYHFERLFKRWAGTTPKRFLQCLRLGHAKSLLADSKSLMDASWETGLSGPSRLHDLFISLDAVTPGEFKTGGSGLEIRYATRPTPFGDCLIAATPRGICRLAFLDGPVEPEIAALEAEWPNAKLTRDRSASAAWLKSLFYRGLEDSREGNSREGDASAEPIHLHVKGTNFQIQVWRALLAIPASAVVSYQNVADGIGRPEAVRAVASAIGSNPVGYLIPCHRVLRSTGALSGYRWGPERKRAILAWEQSNSQDRRAS